MTALKSCQKLYKMLYCFLYSYTSYVFYNQNVKGKKLYSISITPLFYKNPYKEILYIIYYILYIFIYYIFNNQYFIYMYEYNFCITFYNFCITFV